MRQLFDNEDILLDEIQQKEVLPNIPKTRARSILEAFEYIVELAKDSSLDADFFENASVYKICCTQAEIVVDAGCAAGTLRRSE